MIPRLSDPREQAPGPLAKLIDNFNPGITLLVLVWVVGLSARRYGLERGQLSELADRALTSLVMVVPIMLVGWALIALADRFFGLGLLPRDDD